DSCILYWYWLGVRYLKGSYSWQVYKECIPLYSGSGGASTPTTESTGSAAAPEADNGGSQTASSSSTAETPTTTEAPTTESTDTPATEATQTQAPSTDVGSTPTPATTEKCNAPRRRVQQPHWSSVLMKLKRLLTALWESTQVELGGKYSTEGLLELTQYTNETTIEWGRKIRDTPGAAKMLINSLKLWICQVLLVILYPSFFYLFTTLSKEGKTAFAMLLPFIKLFMKNLFARTVVHLRDETPEVVVFNAELFNALFVSYCMQNSPSLWITLEIMIFDAVMMAFSLRGAVVIPFVFSIYLFVMYHLPNRDYYSQLHGMDHNQLVHTLQSVQFYCFLQLVSLLILFYALQHLLGLSPIHQLAFVLEKRYSGVQLKLVFWVFYNAQASLQHSATKCSDFRRKKIWQSTQVELRGRYSAERVLELTTYTQQTSWLRVLVILMVTPIPCLLVTILVDILPLAEPSGGVDANSLYLLRTYYTFLVITFLAIEQFRMSVKVLPYPFWRVICSTMLVSALCTGLLYALALVIGFPLPFSLLTTTPPWILLIAATMAFEWATKIRRTPGAATMLVNTIKLWMCEVLLVFIYPPYFYVFTTLSHEAQMAFALLLPAIKMFMRNLFSRTVLHLTDELPEIVIFSCDVFNALFVSYCMQNSPSMWTTLEIMAVDIVMMAVSLHDADATKNKLTDLEQRIEQEIDWESLSSADGNSRAPTTLERASYLLRLRRDVRPEMRVSSFLELKRVVPIMHSILPAPALMPPAKKRKTTRMEAAKSSVRRGSVYPLSRVAGNGMPRLPVTVRYTRLVQRLLYMAEFLLLLNYVEVIIPLVFSIYLYGVYHLPNREYYVQLRGMNEDELVHTLQNVLFYCSLQLVSLFLLFFALQRKLGLSPMHHLAFVLDKQIVGVQVKLVFWVYYNAQASLQHSGYDYTFHFPWLQQPAPISSE
uniref:Uncharacterized protein n=1 Tax=Phytophthora ramorum TaxID=164328 RepID=H3HCH4_PHYRM